MKRFLAFFSVLLLLLGAFPARGEEITYTGTITGGSLHLRQEPSASGKVLGTYKSGTKVEVLDNDGAWCRVTVGKKTGYMMAQYLKIQANYPHLGWGKTPGDGTVLNLRAGAGDTFPVVYKAMSGAAFELIEEAGGWYRVRCGSRFGYIEKEKITPLSGEYALGFSLSGQENGVTAAEMRSAPREAGSAKTVTKGEGNFTYSLSYPEMGLAPADDKISAWVGDALRLFEEDHRQYHENEQGSFTVEYQALSVDSRYKSVLLFGEYRVGEMKAETLLGLNLDMEEARVLDNLDLLSQNKLRGMLCLAGAVSSVLTGPTDGYGVQPDESWLQWAVMGRDGLQLWLPCGAFLPAGLGTRRLELPYAQVAECMGLSSPTVNSFIRVVDPSKPMIALTFDDGPSEETDKILAVLMEYNARATFCVIGNKVEAYGDVIRRTLAGGNEIACHTWSHPKLTNLSADNIRRQIENTNNAVRNVTDGYEVKVLRPPYGSHNKTVRNICAEMGIYIAHWEVDSKDWSHRNANRTYNTIMKGAKNGVIVLCHDLYESTAAAAARFIPDLVAQGYQLVTVSELLSFYKGGAKPGTVYNRVNPENIDTGN